MSALVVMFGLYAFAQKVKANQAATEAMKQKQLKDEARVEDIESRCGYHIHTFKLICIPENIPGS